MTQATSQSEYEIFSVYERSGEFPDAPPVTPLDTTNKSFEYETLTGNIIRSVVPPGRGASISCKVNQGYLRPFGSSQTAPSADVPNSSISYPPPSRNTGQEETQHTVTRSIQRQPVRQQTASNAKLKSKEWQLKGLSMEFNIMKQAQNKPGYLNFSGEQLSNTEKLPDSTLDGNTFTSITTATTSDGSKGMYAQQEADPEQPITNQSRSEIEMNLDTAEQKNNAHESFSLRREYISRSAQKCVESLVTPLSTYKLIDLVRTNAPSPVGRVSAVRKVIFVDKPEVKVLSSPQSDQETDLARSCTKPGTYLNEVPNAGRDQKTPVYEESLSKEDRTRVCEGLRIYRPTPQIDNETPPLRHIPLSKIPNRTPKEWINPMVLALTTAPESPFHMVHDFPPKPFECGDGNGKTTTSEPRTISIPEKILFQRTSSPRLNGKKHVVLDTLDTEILEIASATAFPEPLPDERAPYIPSTIDIKPYTREDYRPKSPLLNALVVAPEKPFKSNFVRDVPIHEIDFPTPTSHLTMTDALRIETYRSYTPLNPENSLHLFEEAEEEKENKIKKIMIPYEGIQKATPFTQNAVEFPHITKIFPATSEFATMQTFKPSREEVKSPTLSKYSLINLSKDEADLEYEKYFKAKERNKKIIDYFHKKEEDQTQQELQTISSEVSSLSLNSCEKSTFSSNTTSSVQQIPTRDSAVSSPAYLGSKSYQEPSPSVKTEIGNMTSKFHIIDAIEETAEEFDHTEVLFPPPSPLRMKSHRSGLHKPDSIPKYQRNWTSLATQSPARTPEPQELRENIPLAFIDTQKFPSKILSDNHLHKPLAQMNIISSSSTRMTRHLHGSSSSHLDVHNKQMQPEQNSQQQKLKSTPFVVEDQCGPISMAFQHIDNHLCENNAQLANRTYTKSFITSPAPIIPFYQTAEKLCFEEYPAQHSRTYNRRPASPFPDRSRSPASGPPPNPLSVIRAPRMKKTELSPFAPRVLTTGSITTGQSYRGAKQLQHTQNKVECSFEIHSQTLSENLHSFNEPEIKNSNIQAPEDEIGLETESKTRPTKAKTDCQKVKNTENGQESARTALIECKQSHYKSGFEANQTRRLSRLEEEISQLQIISKAISERVANRSDTVFPQLHYSTPSTIFPTRPVLPSHEEPRMPRYVLEADADTTPNGFLKEHKTPYGASIKITQPLEGHKIVDCTKNITFSLSSSSTLASSQQLSNFNSAAADYCTLTKASSNTNYNNKKDASSMNSSVSSVSGTCLVTDSFCPPGQTYCKQQKMNLQQQPIVNQSNNNNFNNAYHPNASAGLTNITATASSAVNPAFAAADSSIFELENNSANNDSSGPGSKSGAFGATSTPKRGRGIYNKAVAPGVRVPLCNSCNKQIRGPFITALGRIWCPDHFTCVNGNCRHPLQDIGFVEEKGDLYCEYCFEKFLAPACSKCGAKIKGDCLNAIGKHFHPECFTCGHCGKMFGNAPFFLEDGNAYCEADWNELFTTKCFACGFPVEAGDRWVEALNHNYHSQCFNCTYCKQNLEGQIFYNKGGRPFCKNHAR